MDGIQNCPYSSCLDEDFCKNLKHEIRTIVSSGTGTKVCILNLKNVVIIYVCILLRSFELYMKLIFFIPK